MEYCLGSSNGACRSRGRSRWLFARCAGVHINFHAHGHFDDLWCSPGHSGLPTLSAPSRILKRKAASWSTQVVLWLVRCTAWTGRCGTQPQDSGGQIADRLVRPLKIQWFESRLDRGPALEANALPSDGRSLVVPGAKSARLPDFDGAIREDRSRQVGRAHLSSAPRARRARRRLDEDHPAIARKTVLVVRSSMRPASSFRS